MELRRNNLTIEVEKEVLLNDPYNEWWSNLTFGEQKSIRIKENMDFIKKLRTRQKGKAKHPRTWRPHGWGRLEAPMDPLESWNHKMAQKKRKKDEQKKKAIDLQRKRE